MPPDAPSLREAGREAARRYAGAGRFARHYAAGKLRHDPVMPALLALGRAEAFGDVADIGCGRGQCAMALLLAGVARKVTGVDHNAGHLAQARAAMADLAFDARQQDFAADQSVPAADTVLLIDVLYQFETAAQLSLLHHAAQAARSRVIIRTADPARGLRSLVTRVLEGGFRRLWPHSGATVNAQPPATLAAALHGAGFDCTIAPCWSGTPFANVLLVARRADGNP